MQINRVIIQLNRKHQFIVNIEHPDIIFTTIDEQIDSNRKYIRFFDIINKEILRGDFNIDRRYLKTLLLKNKTRILLGRNTQFFQGNVLVNFDSKNFSHYKKHVFIEMFNGELVNIVDFLKLIDMTCEFKEIAPNLYSSEILNRDRYKVEIRKKYKDDLKNNITFYELDIIRSASLI